jgi:pimeloyl-ACP methyl ester carboxylesterase
MSPRVRAGTGAARVFGVVALLAVAAAALLFVVRNQERGVLDDAARSKAPGKFVRLSDGMVHFEIAGPDTGDAVVLVHGFSVPSYIWDTTFAVLKTSGYRVLRYDLFGRGYSDRPHIAYDSSLFVRQLDELLDSIGVRGAHLVGLSMGGRVVAQYALAHRSRVRSVTLIDPAFSLQAALTVPLGIALVGEYVFAVGAPGLAQSQLSDFVHPERHPDWPDRYRVQMRYAGFRRAILSTLRSSASGNDRAMYARYGALEIPTLLIWGREDKTVAFAMSDSLRARIPLATFVPVDSAGHLPHIEQPAITHASILGFLRKQQPAPLPSAPPPEQ